MELSASQIESKIYLIRGQKVMLDSDLAEMYGVETKRLKEQVRRNISRFPQDFMFELTTQEVQDVSRTQNATMKQGMNIKYLPFVFTEHGVLMLSSVLRSEQAIKVNIHIMRVYNKIKEMLIANKDILLKLEQLEKNTDKNSKDILVIFSHLRKLIENPKPEKTSRIGFKKDW